MEGLHGLSTKKPSCVDINASARVLVVHEIECHITLPGLFERSRAQEVLVLANQLTLEPWGLRPEA
ncbi:uncharacterized protein LACBIDRAFT_296964 [Laccaria bicolor S238N-H82]|uniref:Predicted protein n=1 Tax=Laccaria bicolor (strain S238N-H82 / ATCC MYA-4686) TaxID=486041 RepID=B0D9N4_LACBS|nr:uncharacterized protein LACBIDRAFT_296964 [Laccaria bicolor S238N-H82]EDR08383.1 predicted protein [Laccaria bicolor S238N-H82]|eukprot:XP_001880608.1 predicted protein [Laccaria bicolor S238N-H82]